MSKTFGSCGVIAGLLTACGGAPAPAPRASAPAPLAAPTTRDDPASIAGDWDYRTRSNCGSVDGVGGIHLEWQRGERTYAERGRVHWPDSGTTIEWWGSHVYDAASRTLHGRVDNTLGDSVEVEWQLVGDAPETLVLRWEQTNGCYGTGTATRPRGP